MGASDSQYLRDMLQVVAAEDSAVTPQSKKRVSRSHFDSIRTFVRRFSALSAEPYRTEASGESPDHVLAIRDLLVASGGRQCSETEFAGPRHQLWAWSIWQQRPSALYIPWQSVSSLFSATLSQAPDLGLTLEGVKEHVRLHPNDPTLVTLASLHENERAVAALLRGATTVVRDWDTREGSEASDGSDGLDAIQKGAVQKAKESPCFLLQGGAGVGKTTTLTALVRGLSRSAQVSVACIAFTHKAKRCMAERLAGAVAEAAAVAASPAHTSEGGLRVSTIHSFIQHLKNATAAAFSGTARHSERYPLFIILDESSMVDLELFGELARIVMASGLAYQLCLVGDVGQLPPVARAEVFRFLVHNPNWPRDWKVSLEHCYRTERPQLFQAYQEIRAGRIPACSKGEFFEWNETEDDKGTDSCVRRMVEQSCSQKGSYLETGHLFIAWQNKDVDRINTWVQQARVRAGDLRKESELWGLYTGDLVMYVGENEKASNKDEAVSNATCGEVTETYNDNKRSLASMEMDHGYTRKNAKPTLKIKWKTETGDVVKTYEGRDGIRDVRLAYCITVHKSQGSEYGRVAVACYEIQKMMRCLDRRWLYTAATRGKENVVLIAAGIKRFLAMPVRGLPPMGLSLEGLDSKSGGFGAPNKDRCN
jgi:hypothetical protein